MRRDITELPAGVQEQVRALEALPEDRVDTTDIPEVVDWSDARRGVFCRPAKQRVTLSIDAEVLAWFKAHATGGQGYQADISDALRGHIRRADRSAG